MNISMDKIPLGISEDDVALGSHLIHFWNTEEEFERGVRFFEPAIIDEAQYCVLFGHDEANTRVLTILRTKGHDVDALMRHGRLVVLRRESSASVTLAKIETAFSAALQHGAKTIRYLGNQPALSRRAPETVFTSYEFYGPIECGLDFRNSFRDRGTFASP